MSTLNEQMRVVSKNLDNYLKTFQDDRKRKEILEYAAKPLIEAAQSAAPVGTRIHYRYSKQRKKSGKGKGVVVAKYSPGNLRGSVGVLKKLRKAKNVFVGPTLAKGKSFGPTRSDGYYAHMVEYGTSKKSARPFMRPAFSRAGAQVLRRIELAARVFHNRFKPIT